MQAVLTFDQRQRARERLAENGAEQLLDQHMARRRAAAFEGYAAFDLCSFDWYHVDAPDTDTHRVLIYFSREDLLIFCEDAETARIMEAVFPRERAENDQALREFFVALLADDMEYLDGFEAVISDTEDSALSGSRQDYMGKISEYRRELLRLKRYYTQLQAICDGLLDNENGLLGADAALHLGILHNRVDRCHAAVLNLRDYVTQMREACQSQIDIEQNALMKVFTLITAVFLPLTLMVGWYGMNFRNMPELEAPFAYPVFIAVSVAVCGGLLIYFKKKKWF